MPSARTKALVVAALALIVVLSGCAQEPRRADVRDLALRDTPVRGAVKVAGVIREKPGLNADRQFTFLLFAPDSKAVSIPVVIGDEAIGQSPTEDITGLKAIVIGRFDGRQLFVEQLLVDWNTGPYGTETSPSAQ